MSRRQRGPSPYGLVLREVMEKRGLELAEITRAMIAAEYTEHIPKFNYQMIQRVRDQGQKPPRYFGRYLEQALEDLGVPLTSMELYHLVYALHYDEEPPQEEPSPNPLGLTCILA